MISQKTKTAITAIKVGVMALDNKKIDVRDLSEDVLLLLKKSYPEALVQYGKENRRCLFSFL